MGTAARCEEFADSGRMESRNGDVELGVAETRSLQLSNSARFDAYAPARRSISDAAQETTSAAANNLKRAWSNELFNANLTGFAREERVYRRWENIVLAYQSLGIVFGDLATSPLYVYPTIQFDKLPTESDCLGILSIIFWTITLVSLLKYVFIVMAADDHGEGGTFAVYSLICQYANIRPTAGIQPVQVQSDKQSDLHLVNLATQKNSTRTNKTKEFFEKSSMARGVLLVVAIVGASMVFGDGVLTPAISVLSSIGGIQTQFPSISQTVVLVISAIILLILFSLQRFGTRTMSFLFSPIMALWCISIFCIGVYNIVVYEPSVFKAVSPHYIILFFQNNRKSAWVALGGSVLCITGTEAMFADLGHFNKRSIQIAFLTMVYPSTLVAYAGETAYVIKNPEDHASAFFKSVPHAVFWPVFIISTLAAIVASQSLISASFSVVKQSSALECFPRVQLIHTSSDREGQVYCPEINYVLMGLCLVVLAGFRNAVQIGNAFGVTVVFLMFLTTCLISLVMLMIWETPWYLILLFLGIYGFIEGVYLTSVLYKFPQGGWVPFAISVLFGVIMLSWSYGHLTKVEYELRAKLGMDELAALLASTRIQRVPGICFFYTNLVHGVPPIISHYVKNVRTLHQVIVFVSIRHLPVVTVLPRERFLVSRIGHKGVYRCVARYGYMESISMEGSDFKEQMLQSLKDYLQTPEEYQARFAKHPAIEEDREGRISYDDDTALRARFVVDELEGLDDAHAQDVVHVLGKTRMLTNKNAQWWKKIVLNYVYAFLRANCREAYDEMKIPPSNLLEVRMVYDVE